MSRLISLFAALAVATGLSACSTPATKLVKLLPPTDLMAPCTVAAYELRTNADLARAILLERQALALCNVDKAALRAWAGGR